MTTLTIATQDYSIESVEDNRIILSGDTILIVKPTGYYFSSPTTGVLLNECYNERILQALVEYMQTVKP